jgi:hypothetical protein
VTTKTYFRPPARDFGEFECSWPEQGNATSVLVGESVAVIGWIPRTKRGDDLPNGFLRKAWPDAKSVRLLLKSGNQKPPNVFERGSSDLLRHLDSLDFRGAISLLTPTLYIANGRPVFLRGQALGRTGYTPFRLGPNQYSSEGTASRFVDIYETGDQVVIRIFLRMKLGRLGCLAAKAVTWNWPPWATMTVEYAFDTRRQTAEVTFSGTAVPSQRRYLDWRLDSDYDIETELSGAGYQQFVEAGRCQDALAFRYSRPVKISPRPAEFTIEELRTMSSLGANTQ